MDHRIPSLPPTTALTRFSVAPLSAMTRRLADVASGRAPADRPHHEEEQGHDEEEDGDRPQSAPDHVPQH